MALQLPRDELAFRKEYHQLVADGLVTTIFRPGNRIYPNWRGYKLGEVVTARIIEQCGCDRAMRPPVFNELRRRVRISSIQHLPMYRLCDRHFEGSSPDVMSKDDLCTHLSRIYGSEINPRQDSITRIELKYLPTLPAAQPSPRLLRHTGSQSCG